MLNSRFFILPARLTNHFQLIPRILLLPEVSQSSRPNVGILSPLYYRTIPEKSKLHQKGCTDIKLSLAIMLLEQNHINYSTTTLTSIILIIHSPKKVKDIIFFGVFFIIRDLSLQFNKKYPQKNNILNFFWGVYVVTVPNKISCLILSYLYILALQNKLPTLIPGPCFSL